MKWVILIEDFGILGCKRKIHIVDNAVQANLIADSYRNRFDNNKIKVLDVLPYDEYVVKYLKSDISKSVTVNIFDNETGDYLHCFDGTSDEVCNGEVLVFHYTTSDGIEIDNAEFVVTWCSKVYNGNQTALVKVIPNSGEVIFSNELKTKIDDALKTLYEVENCLDLMGKKDEFKKLIEAHNILSMYQK